MYAEAGIHFPYLQSFPCQSEHIIVPKSIARGNPVHTSTMLEYDLGGGDLFKALEQMTEPLLAFGAMPTNVSMISSGEDVITGESVEGADIKSVQNKQWLNERSLAPTATMMDYSLGEGDLFKAPETIIEEPGPRFDTMTATIPLISVCEDVISTQTIKNADIESIEREHLLNEVFYDFKKDLLVKSAVDGSFSEVSDIPVMHMDSLTTTERDRSLVAGPIQKSISSDSLCSMEWIGGAVRPSFLDFQTMNLGADFGMRRAFSEGDIQTLRSGNGNPVHSVSKQMLTISNYVIEDRRQKLSRYRRKKAQRNFDRRIKYACRKALADSQPRFRGRFAKIGVADIPNRLK